MAEELFTPIAALEVPLNKEVLEAKSLELIKDFKDALSQSQPVRVDVTDNEFYVGRTGFNGHIAKSIGEVTDRDGVGRIIKSFYT